MFILLYFSVSYDLVILSITSSYPRFILILFTLTFLWQHFFIIFRKYFYKILHLVFKIVQDKLGYSAAVYS